MRKEIYSGFLLLKSSGDADDILFISTLDYPLAYELDWISGERVNCRYWITEKQATVADAVECFIGQLSGSAATEYRSRYSEVTGYLWTDEELNIGGHNLLKELKSSIGKWVILEIETI